MTTPKLRVLKILLAIGLFASALHFLDNAFEIQQYPGPAWLRPSAVLETWVFVSVLGVIALTRRSRDTPFFICASLYSLVLMSGLLHYAYGTSAQMAARSNFTVVFEALTGVLLAVALIRELKRSNP